MEVDDDSEEESSPVNLNKFATPHGDDISFNNMTIKTREPPKVEEKQSIKRVSVTLCNLTIIA